MSLYRFATHQQTSTPRRQKFGFFYLKFSSKLNELSLKLKKQQQIAKND